MAGPSATSKGVKRKSIPGAVRGGKKRRVESTVCFSTMPLDNLYQIFLDLMPTDLMHISRVNKNLRCVLLSSSSLYVWKKTLEKIPELPDCPEDMNIPQLVNLIYGYHCNFCDIPEVELKAKEVVLRRSFQYRFQICDTCIPTHLERAASGWNIEGVMPKLSFKIGRTYKDYIFAPVNRSLKEALGQLPKRSKERNAWIAERRKALTSADILETEVAKWKAREPGRLLLQRREVNQRILEEMKKLLIELGWGEELQRVCTATYPRNTLFDKINFSDLHEPLLPEEWEEARPHLERYLGQRKSVRLAELGRSRICNAVEATKEILSTYGQMHYVVPPAMDILLQQPVLEAVCAFLAQAGTLESPEEVAAEKHSLHQVIQASLPDLQTAVHDWRVEKETELLAIAAKCPALAKYIRDPEDPASTLQLAVCVFVPRNRRYGPDYLLTYPRILIQSDVVTYHLHNRNAREFSFDSFTDPSTTLEVRREMLHAQASPLGAIWNGQNEIEVYETFIPVLESLIRVCGMDPATTTHAQLMSVDPLLRCIHPRCNSPGVPLKDRPHYLRSVALRHWGIFHASGSDYWAGNGSGSEAFEIVEDPEAMDLFGRAYNAR